MINTKETLFTPSDELFGTLPPELMTISQLADICRRVSAEFSAERANILARPQAVLRIMESLPDKPSWYAKAVMRSLGESLALPDFGERDIVLSHLFNMMFFGGRPVSGAAARCAGRIIASACKKDMSVWSDFLRRTLFVRKNEGLSDVSFFEDPLNTVFFTLYNTVREDLRKPVLAAYASYFKSTRWDTWTCLRLITGIFRIPVKEWGAMQRGNIGGFIRYFLRQDNPEVRIASFYLLLMWLNQDWKPSEDFRGYLLQSFSYIYENDPDISPAEIELISRLSLYLKNSSDEDYQPDAVMVPRDRVLFQDNLKSNHSWLFKTVNLRILKDRHCNDEPDSPGFDAYAAHLLILLRLNPDEIVFHQAGEDILSIAPLMSEQQKIEIAKELFKVIEAGIDATGYVPHFMGRFFAKMDPASRSELLGDIRDLCAGHDDQVTGNALEMVCCIAEGLAAEAARGDKVFMQRLCGILSQNMYSDLNGAVSHVLYAAGTELYGKLPLPGSSSKSQYDECFADLVHNIMIRLRGGSHADLLCHPEAFENISRWLSAYSSTYPDVLRPVAFYAGTFDPFTNGHHAIVRELAEMGYQVYVNVHDYAWDRNIQPLLIRRQIAAMSVTDVPHVFIFPEDIAINTDNPKDLARLKELFPKQKVWLAVRNALIECEPAYNEPPSEGSIHSFPHIVLVRSETHGYSDEANLSGHLIGEMISIRLPVYYEHMTADEVRAAILDGKSIDGLVTAQVANFIRSRNLYADSRSFKPEITGLPVTTEADNQKYILYLNKKGKKIPAAEMHFHECEDSTCVCLDKIEQIIPDEMYAEIIFDETLIALQAQGYARCICREGTFTKDVLLRSGFIKQADENIWSVDMTSPIVLFTDVLTCISADFVANEELRGVCAENAMRLQKAAALLHPGCLVLNINTEVMYYRLSEKIKEHCIGPDERHLCVPFGKVLRYENIPGVMVMPLTSEKRYEPDLGSFTIAEKAGYPALRSQIRSIRSMDMPFVLVDDLFHKGYRMNKIKSSLNEEGLREDCVIVAVRSRIGSELAAREGYSVDSVYDVPDMKLWIIESDMLPFFGGDKVIPSDPAADILSGALPSIYPILPYQLPSFLKDAPYEAVCALSEACLENAMQLYETLERLYEEKYHRQLTFVHLEEVIDEAGWPDGTAVPERIADLPVSMLVKNEMLRLERLKK